MLPGIFCSTVTMRFHWRAWIFHFGPTRGKIGSLNLFWGQTSQVKLEFWEVCVFVKWHLPWIHDEIKWFGSLVTWEHVGCIALLERWSNPPRAEHMKSRRQQKEWNMKSRYRSAQVIWGFFWSNPVLSGAAWITSFFVAAYQPIPFSPPHEIGAVFRIHKPQPNGIITIFWGKFLSEKPFHKGIVRMVNHQLPGCNSCQRSCSNVLHAEAGAESFHVGECPAGGVECIEI